MIIIEELLAKYKIENVSRETINKLETYSQLLIKWNKSINLVSKNSLGHIWERHIVDSMQLTNYLPSKDITLVDLGSGAGLPGLILSLLDYKKVILIESDKRKCMFLNEAAKISEQNIYIYNSRIEELIINSKIDIITSRALAPLEKLLELSEKFIDSQTKLLFLKGEKISEEIAQAEKNFEFEYQLYESVTNKNSYIIEINNLLKRERYD